MGPRTSQLRPPLLVAAMALSMATVGAVAWPTPPLGDDVPHLATLRALAHWDAGWYGAIARDGYSYQPGQQSSVAFFPLYPLAIAGLMALGVNRWLAGAALSLAFGLAGILLFDRWARALAPPHASAARWLLVLYPFSIYLYGIVYSDGLFLLCAVAAFLALEDDRPWWAAFFGALAAAARPVAPALVLGLLARSVERRRRAGLVLRPQDAVPALAGVGLAAWMAYLWWRFGDALAFVHVQDAPGWHAGPAWALLLKLEWFRVMFPRVAPLVAVRLGGHALASLVALALVVPTWRRLGWGYGVYALVAVGIPLASSGDFQGMGRYVIAAFPLFLGAATLLEHRPRLRRALLVSSGALLAACALAFGAGGYVA